MQRSILIILFLLMFRFSFSQQVLNSKLFFDSLVSTTQLDELTATRDNHFLMYGVSNLNRSWNARILIKTNFNGDTIWTHVDTMNAWFGSGFSVRELSNGNYVTVANTIDSAYVTLFDSNGNVLSETKLGDTTDLNFSSVIELNGFLYFFCTKAHISTEIVKTDLDVNQITRYSDATYAVGWNSGSVIIDGNGFLATGSKYIGTDIQPALVRMDTLCQNEWTQTYNLSYGGLEPDMASGIIKTADNGYAFWAYNDITLVKVDSVGAMEWQRVFPGFAFIPRLNSVDSSILISHSPFHHYKMDLAGNIVDTLELVWNLPFQGSSLNYLQSAASIHLGDTIVYLMHYVFSPYIVISGLTLVDYYASTTDLSMFKDKNGLIIYPTLLERAGSVFVSGKTEQVNSYKLISINGNVITQADIVRNRESETVEIILPENLSNGFYFLELFSSAYRYTFKIIVM